MSSWPHLPKAPISEALIDIRVQLPSDISVEDLSPFRQALREAYPHCRERRRGRAELRFRGTAPPNVEAFSEAPDGLLLTSVDGLQVVQARLDGFTFSRLKPYETWDALRVAAGGKI